MGSRSRILATGLVACLLGGLGGTGVGATLALLRDTATVSSNTFTTAATFPVSPPSNLTLSASCRASSIAARGATSASGVNSVLISRPAGVVSGDVMLAQVVVRTGGSTIGAPAGWSQVRNESASTQIQSAVFVKVAGASEAASYSFTTSTLDARIAGGIAAYSGVSSTSPVQAHAGTPGSGTSIDAPSVTTTSANAMLVAFWTARQQSIGSPPAAMTARWNLFTGGGANSVGLAGADQLVAAAGATGTRSATTGSAFDWIGQSVALRPATYPRVTASWTATSTTTADGYKLQRWLGATQQTEWTITPRTTVQYVDDAAAASSSFTYRLRAYGTGASDSTVVSATVSTGACSP